MISYFYIIYKIRIKQYTMIMNNKLLFYIFLAFIISIVIFTIFYPNRVEKFANKDFEHLTNITDVICNDYKIVFLEDTNRALACGYNGWGGTGTKSNQDSVATEYYPRYVLSNTGSEYLTNIIKIVCSNYHSMFLQSDGKE